MSQYPQDPQQQPYQQQGYQPQQPYQSQPDYGQPYQPQPDYGQPYSQQPVYGIYQQPPAPAPKPKTFGIIAFAVVVLGSLIFAFPWAQLDLVTLAAWAEANQNVSTPSDPPAGAMSQFMMVFAGGAAVFIGFILSIVATATNRGRIWGIIGIVASFILPWVLLGIFIAMNPTVR